MTQALASRNRDVTCNMVVVDLLGPQNLIRGFTVIAVSLKFGGSSGSSDNETIQLLFFPFFTLSLTFAKEINCEWGGPNCIKGFYVIKF